MSLVARAPRRQRFQSLRPDPSLGADGARNVGLDLLQSFLGGLFVALVANFAAVYASHLNASAFLLSILLAAPYTGALLSPIVVARLPPSVGPRSIALSIAVGRLLVVVVPLSPNPAIFIALMVGMYLLVSMPSPYVVDVMSRLYPPSVRGRYIGYSRIALTAGLTIGAPIGGFVLDHYGPDLLFPLGALVGVLGAFAYSNLRPGPPSQAQSRPSIRATFGLLGKDRLYALIVAAMTIWGFGALLAGPFYPLMLVDRFHVSYQQVGSLTLAQSVCWFISYIFLARRIDRMAAQRVMMVSMLLSALLPASYFLAPTADFLLIGYAANGFAAGGVDLGLLQLIVRSAPPGRTPQYTALVNAVSGARGILAPFAGSALGTASALGTSGVLLGGTVLCVVGAGIALQTGRSKS